MKWPTIRQNDCGLPQTLEVWLEKNTPFDMMQGAEVSRFSGGVRASHLGKWISFLPLKRCPFPLVCRLGSGYQAIRILERFLRRSRTKPDVMLLDLNISVGHYEDVLGWGGQMPEAARIKLYGVSGRPPVCDAVRVGLRRCFLKPLQPEEMVRTIKNDLAA